MRWRKGWGRAARPARAPTARALTPTTLSTSLQAKRRRQFECSQDKAKRKVKEVRMRRSKKYQYNQITAEDAYPSMEPAPFAEFFAPTTDAFVGPMTGRRD